MPLTWLEINTNAILSNIKSIKKRLGKQTKFVAVIKANAYGHGLLEVAKAIESSCDYLAVFDFNDAVFLRKKAIKSAILVLGPTFPEQFPLAAKHKIEITISNLEILKKALKFNQKLLVHICADTGMGRDGFTMEEKSQVLNLLQKNKNLDIKGLYAHFSSADDSRYTKYTKEQLDGLLTWKKDFAKIGLTPITHHSATAGSMQGYSLDMARSGSAVYGLWPSLEMRDNLQNEITLKPALEWKAKIIEVKYLPKGHCISYNCTFTLKRNSKLAILPIGYYDGIPRHSSNKGHFLVKGKKVPQLGRVTMNMVVLDVTDIPGVKIGDIATIIGKDGKNSITSEDWGTWAETINYEITTRINPALNRIFN